MKNHIASVIWVLAGSIVGMGSYIAAALAIEIYALPHLQHENAPMQSYGGSLPVFCLIAAAYGALLGVCIARWRAGLSSQLVYATGTILVSGLVALICLGNVGRNGLYVTQLVVYMPFIAIPVIELLRRGTSHFRRRR